MNKRLHIIQTTYMSFIVLRTADLTKMRTKKIHDGLQYLYIIFNYGIYKVLHPGLFKIVN